jgi:hypothetical protein
MRSLEEPIRVTSMISADGAAVSGWSTLARELAFVVSHTIHHQAIIGILLGFMATTCLIRFGHSVDAAAELRAAPVCTASIVPLETASASPSTATNGVTVRGPRAGIRRLRHRVAVFPIDPFGGGTWIGVNDLGLVAALLNRTTTPGMPTDPLRPSRGQIIRAARLSVAGRSVDDCLALEPLRFNPFRLFLIQDSHAAVATSADDGLSIEQIELERPGCCVIVIGRQPRRSAAPPVVRTDIRV